MDLYVGVRTGTHNKQGRIKDVYVGIAIGVIATSFYFWLGDR